ncbi:MAG: hypothetical protein HYX25_00385 [Candidatus Solibacter usitatus]|nr:hypothetical protein [Candidatus Solibacter usitatus]
MNRKSIFRARRPGRTTAILLVAGLAAAGSLAQAATFGKVTSIGGQPSDIALDEARGVLYIANFSASRIEVQSLADGVIHSSLNVPPQPGALALSPDGRFLLVAHFGNFALPQPSNNALTVLGLGSNTRQTFGMGHPPLGVAFGIDGLALVVTTGEFLLFDPVSGSLQVLDTIAGVTAKTLPVPPANFPAQVIAASVAVSGDGYWIYGLTDTFRFRYDVMHHALTSVGYTSTPPMGPRAVSVSQDGSYFTAGWGLFNRAGQLLSQFPDPLGQLNIGSTAIDSVSGVIYAEIPPAGTVTAAPTDPVTPPVVTPVPVLMLVDSDNLAIRQTLRLPEHMAGKSVLNAHRDTLYAVSDSGALTLPVGSLNSSPRVLSGVGDLIFRGSFCDRRPITQEITIYDPSGGATDFTLTTDTAGITISPASGVTPARVKITVDPMAFAGQDGTVVALVHVASNAAINVAADIRVLINSREPDQRGEFVAIAGTPVDLLADPARDRFYVLVGDRNQVLVYTGAATEPMAILRTANTPTQMALTVDRHYLLVGHENSQLVYIFDLNTLAPLLPLAMPPGHYPHSIAASGNAVLVASRVAGPVHTIDRIDVSSRTAATLPALGIFANNIHVHTVLTASANGASILAAMADGTVLLYSASAETFTAARKDFTALAGAYAASNNQQFVVDNNVLNSSLSPALQLENATGLSSGLAFVDRYAVRTTSPGLNAPGVIERADLSTGIPSRPTRMVESPLLGNPAAPFTRTLAALANRSAIVSLTASGFTVLPWNYDEAYAVPMLVSAVSSADFTPPVASGGLISVFGSHLSSVTAAASEIPIPTILGGACLTVNGDPAPLLFISPQQINAQLPFEAEGDTILALHSPGGVSNNLNITVLDTAPSVFRNGTAGPDTGIAVVVRGKNNQLVTLANPVHRGDTLVIYATGMGRTTLPIAAGMPGPVDPLLAVAVEPEVTLGGVALPVLFAGLAPGMVGVDQINVTVPSWAPTGMSVVLRIVQGTISTSVLVRVIK